MATFLFFLLALALHGLLVEYIASVRHKSSYLPIKLCPDDSVLAKAPASFDGNCSQNTQYEKTDSWLPVRIRSEARTRVMCVPMTMEMVT